MLKKIRSETGYSSIEAIVVGAFMLYAIFALIGIYLYLLIQSFIFSDVVAFSHKIERNGGITVEELDEFKTYLASNYIHLQNKEDSILIEFVSPDGTNLIVDNVEHMKDSTLYLSREAEDTGILRVKMPSQHDFLKPTLLQNEQTALGSYVYSKIIYSERY